MIRAVILTFALGLVPAVSVADGPRAKFKKVPSAEATTRDGTSRFKRVPTAGVTAPDAETGDGGPRRKTVTGTTGTKPGAGKGGPVRRKVPAGASDEPVKKFEDRHDQKSDGPAGADRRVGTPAGPAGERAGDITQICLSMTVNQRPFDSGSPGAPDPATDFGTGPERDRACSELRTAEIRQ